MGLRSPVDPIPRAAFRLRILGYNFVHRGDLDAGIGVTTLCGKFVRSGSYEKTDDPVTCRACLRIEVRRGSFAIRTTDSGGSGAMTEPTAGSRRASGELGISDVIHGRFDRTEREIAEIIDNARCTRLACVAATDLERIYTFSTVGGCERMNVYQVSMSPSRLHGVREWVIVFYRKLPHVMNLRILNRAMRDRQIAGDFDSVEGLANRIDSSRSTVSRFFSGKNTSLTFTLRVLEALKVNFDQMFMEISPALLAKLQADGMVYDHNGVTVITVEILTWPEATEIRKHFGLVALTDGPAQPALPAASEQYRDRVGRQLPPRTGG
jgi:hypothetical protein